MPVLKSVPVAWAHVTKVNTQFEPCWEIQVELTPDQAETLQAEAKAINKKGIKIKNENGKITYRFRRKLERADGKGENAQPTVLDKDGKEFTGMIGNGSLCNVQYGFSPFDNKFGKGVTSDLKGVRVIELVPYGEQDGEGLLDDDVPTKSKPSKADSNEFDDEDF